MSFCVTCGTPSAPTSRFCGKCGTPVQSAPHPPPVAQGAPPATLTTQTPPQQMHSGNPPIPPAQPTTNGFPEAALAERSTDKSASTTSGDRAPAVPIGNIWLFIGAVTISGGLVAGLETALRTSSMWGHGIGSHQVIFDFSVERIVGETAPIAVVLFFIPALAAVLASRLMFQRGRSPKIAWAAALACTAPSLLVIVGVVTTVYVILVGLVVLGVLGWLFRVNVIVRFASRAAFFGGLIGAAFILAATQLPFIGSYWYGLGGFLLTSTVPALTVGLIDAFTHRLPRPNQSPMASFAPVGSAPARTNGFAITSLVTGILGLSVLATTFGFIALSQIKRSPATERGRGMAIAGIVLSFVWLAITIALVVILHVGVNSINSSFS